MKTPIIRSIVALAIGLLASLFFSSGQAFTLVTPSDPLPGEALTLRPGDPNQPMQLASISGLFTVIWGDGQFGSVSHVLYFVTDDSGQTIQLLLSEEMLQAAGGVLALNGERVSVQGRWLRAPTPSSGEAVLSVSSISLDLQARAPAALKAAAGVYGSQPWISILCKFSDVITEPKTLSYFQGMYTSTLPGLDHYWREVSYNLINVLGSGALGWYTLPYTRGYYVYDMDSDGQVELDFTRATNDCTAVADPYVYFPGYVGINMMFNAELDGSSWGGGQILTRDSVTKYYRTTWEPPWGYSNIGVVEHEMGHGFGLPHSSGMYGQTYDNEWDVMSDHWAGCYRGGYHGDPTYGCMGQHTISYHKDTLGWITATNKYVVTAGNRVTLTLEQLALPQTNNYLMAQIPIKGASSRFYSVEARRLVGYDNLSPLPGAAVVIHEVDTSRGRPANVVDVDYNGDTGDAGAMWLPGETFTTTYGITATVISTATTGFVVAIDNQSFPTFYYVAPNGADGGNNCTNSASPCATVQRAVDVAELGGEIRVAAGVYAGVSARAGITQAIYLSKTVTVRGGYTTTNWTTSFPLTQPTTLDAQGRGRVIYIPMGWAPTVEGLRLTGGNAAGLGGQWVDDGGGIYVVMLASPAIRNCVIFSNTAQTGGGVFLAQNSYATLANNAIISNVASFGGGVVVLWSNGAVLDGNTIMSNTAQMGGGMYIYESSVHVMSNNVFAGNRVTSSGSGVYLRGAAPNLLHSTIARNTGGEGSGVYVGYSAVAMLTNTILVSQSVGIYVSTGSTATLQATLWGSGAWANQADWGGAGSIITGAINVRGDPAFVNPGAGDYHIAASSAAMDRGIDAGVRNDIDGDARPCGSGYDMGADEAMPSAALIITKRGTPNPVQAGARLTYTLYLTNTGSLDLHGVVTDVLPSNVTPGGMLTWTVAVTAPGGVWTQSVVVTVQVGYIGALTNVVRVATAESASGIFTETIHTPPVANFTAAPTSGLRPLTVFFTDTSSGAVSSWLWSFGDGGNSALQNSSHVYNSMGVYTVSLRVSGPGGSNTLTRTNYITVAEPPLVANFTAAPTSGLRPLTVFFTDTSSGAVSSWLWTFGDGGNSALQNSSHVYNSMGVYTVSLRVSGPGGSSALTRTNYITVAEPPPVADFIASPLNGTRPLTVTFSDLSSGAITSWLWEFGDGLTSVLPSPTHVYNLTGTFAVTLTVAGPGGSDREAKSNYITVTDRFAVYLPVVLR